MRALLGVALVLGSALAENVGPCSAVDTSCLLRVLAIRDLAREAGREERQARAEERLARGEAEAGGEGQQARGERGGGRYRPDCWGQDWPAGRGKRGTYYTYGTPEVQSSTEVQGRVRGRGRGGYTRGGGGYTRGRGSYTRGRSAPCLWEATYYEEAEERPTV